MGRATNGTLLKTKRIVAAIAAACTILSLGVTGLTASPALADDWHTPADNTVFYPLSAATTDPGTAYDRQNSDTAYESGSTAGNTAGVPGNCLNPGTGATYCTRTANPASALNTNPSDPDFQNPGPDAVDGNGVTFNSDYAHFNGYSRLLTPVTQEFNAPAMSSTAPISWGNSVRLPSGSYPNEYACSDTKPVSTWLAGGTSCSEYTNYNYPAHGSDTKANTTQVGLSSGSGAYGVVKTEISATRPGGGVTLYGVPTCSIRSIVAAGYAGAGVMADKDQTVNSSVSVDNAAWHDIKCVATDADIKVYVDTTLRGTKTYANAAGTTIKLLPPVFNTTPGVSQDYMSMGGKRSPKLQIDQHDTLNGDLKNVFFNSGAVPLTPNLVDVTSGGGGWVDHMFCFVYDGGDTTKCDLGDRTEFKWAFGNDSKGAFLTSAATIVSPTPLSGASAYSCYPASGTIAIEGHSLPGDSGSGYSCDNATGGPYHLVTQAEVDAGVVDAGVASYTGPESGTSTPNYSVTIPLQAAVFQNSALGVSYSDTTTDVDSSSTVNLGDTVNGTYVVTNTGNVTMTSVSVLGDVAGNTPTCGSSTLAPAATTNCTFTHTINSTDVSNGGYTAGGGHANGTNPPSEAGTSDSAAASTHTTTIAGASSELQIVKTPTVTDLNGSGGSADNGDRITSSYHVINSGTRTITGIVVTDPKEPNITCSATTLAGGADTTCTSGPYFVVPADTTAGSVTSGGTAVGTDSLGATITSNTSTTVTTVGASSQLIMTRTASVADTNTDGVTGDAGDVITYAIGLSNTNTVNGLNHIEARSYYPAGAGSYTVVSGCPATLTKSGGAGPTGSCSETHTITSSEVTAGKVSVWSYLHGTWNTVGTLAASNGINIDTPTYASPVAGLSLTKTATAADTNTDGVTGDAGDKISYSYLVTNTGLSTITSVAVSDTQGPTITCSPTTLTGGASVTCTSADYTITSGDVTAGSVNGTATATGSSGGTVTSSPSSTSTPTNSAPAANDKVLLIIFENTPLAGVTNSNMPFLYSMIHGTAYSGTTYKAANLTQYKQVGTLQPSLPNYLTIAAGNDFGVTDDKGPSAHKIDPTTFPSLSTFTVFDQAIANSKTAKIYADGMQTDTGAITTCRLNNGSTDGTNLNDLYAVRHTMQPYFDSTTSRANCNAKQVSQNVAGSTPLQTDVTNGTLPNVGYLAPNLKHQGHSPYSVTDADNYLASIVPTIYNGSDFTTGHLSIIITTDEGSHGGTPDPILPFLVLNKNAVAGCTVSTTGYTHYGLNHWLSSIAGGSGINNGVGAADPRTSLTTTCIPGL